MKLFKAMLCSVAALSLLLPAAHAQAAPTVVKIALTQPTGHPTTDLIRGQFKKTIEEKTNGRFRIDVFDNYSFGNFEAVVQGLQFGMLQFAQESPSNLSIYDPKLMIFDLPYLMPDYDAVNILLDGKVGKELSRSLEKIGIKGMGWIALGTRFYWMNKPFHTMAEAKSMKIRATASKVHISMTKAFGMNPTPMAWSETFTALQQGTVAGVDVDIHSAVSANLHEVAPISCSPATSIPPICSWLPPSSWTPCLLKTVRFLKKHSLKSRKSSVVPSTPENRNSSKSCALRAWT